MSSHQKRGLVIIGLVLTPFIIGLLLTFEIIKIPFPTDMADQIFIDYQEGERLLPPDGAVPVQGLSLIPEQFPVNPVPPDEVSIQRGAILYEFHCNICHGVSGRGDGRLSQYFDRTPENLTTTPVSAEFDGSVYLTILQGFGQMPPLGENLTPRERWDVINYIRSFPSQ